MRVFFTGIQSLGEGKDAPAFYMRMDKILNDGLADEDYGDGIDLWFLMFVFQRENAPEERGRERTLYKRQKRELDLRLFVDHEAWRRARREKDPAEQYRILYDVAVRSFDIMRTKRIPHLDVDAFENDVDAIAAAHGWTRLRRKRDDPTH
ncbi:hypothetical protein [Microbacterium sp.]|uniref:hypothetical protein n=1 Tax=Microbacterium sp. TaxID=51671 RepID=UPI003A89EAE9